MGKRTDNGNGLSFHSKKKFKFNIAVFYDILSWVLGIAAAVFLAFMAVMLYGIRTKNVGSSMEPLLCNGQDVLIDKVSYSISSPKRGDVIVFLPNGNLNTHFYIKRIVGMPGESVQIRDGKVFINDEPYMGDVADDTRDAGIAADEIVLENDEYFVLGDNRSNSEDSRSANIGNVKMSTIEGKVWLRLRFGSYDTERIK